ncbi:MAG: hypothetical protein ACK5M7_05825 [Draconibacterium sp.]
MSERLKSNLPSPLILADFSDGSWYATSFAMQFLYREKSSVSILQTYQNLSMGHFMMRKLSHQLKKITKYELKALKNKLLTNFRIEKHEVNTLSVEGELNFIINYKPLINGPHNIVLCTYSSFGDSCNRQNGCLEKIVDTSDHPLFILPETFEGETSKNILFVGNPEKNPSEQLYNQVLEICKRTQSKLEILFVGKKQEALETVKSFYHEHAKGIDITVRTIRNNSKCKGIKKYLKSTDKDLIVIAND